MTMRPYSTLNRIYDWGWADFSLRYAVFLKELLQMHEISGGDILDLACGTGTLAIEMARRGYHVDGIDICPEMIEKARAKSAGRKELSFTLGDISGFRVERKYDIVTCTFDSINYLVKPAEVIKMLKNAAGCLQPGGLLVFDSNTRQLYLNYQEEINKNELDGISFIQRCRFSPSKNIAVTTFEFANGAREIHQQRPYDYNDLGPMLSDTGFQVMHLYSWFDRSPYCEDTEKLFCIAQKMQPVPSELQGKTD